MDRVKQPRFCKKAGGQIPRHVLQAMARLHPNVAILWHRQMNRWVLVQNCRGKQFMIRMLGDKKRFEPPTLANTVYVLNKSHPANFSTARQQRQLMESLDANPGLEAAKRRATGMIADGSKDAFNVLTNRVVVPR